MSGTTFNIDFMGKRHIAAVFSIVLIILSIGDIAINGLSLGLDFTGGTQVEVGFADPVEMAPVQEELLAQHYNDAVPVYFGSENEVLIRFSGQLSDIAARQINAYLEANGYVGDELQIEVVTQNDPLYQSRVVVRGADGLNQADLANVAEELFPSELYGVSQTSLEDSAAVFLLENSMSDATSQRLIDGLQARTGDEAELKRNESVGSQVGEELWDSVVMGGLFALAVVMVYIALRFQFKFSVGAVVALAHDVLIVIGLFSLFHWEFDLTVFAAVLAVIGYSLNDTIVVSDRIRENFRKLRKGSAIEVINTSINQTIGRTLVTSLTTLLVLFSLLIFGGELIHNFALALIIGVAVGTYSSVYVAANVMVWMQINKEDLAVPVKEGVEFDEMP